MITDIIQKLVDRDNLSEIEARHAMEELMAGRATDAQVAGFLTSLRMKGETASELATFARVMRELEGASGSGARIDPFVERLRQCPEAFTAGEMVGKMFKALQHGEDDSEGEERYLPPAGVVMPLV